MDRILRPGRNCWRVEHADRVAVLIDGARYFEVLAEALDRAERSIFVLGWDIHSKVRIGRRAAPEDGEELARALDRITAARPELEVRILSWDPAPIYAFERELMPVASFAWRTGERVDVRLAGDHPSGASHHQKVVVVDDRVAFVGGIDLTTSRWDERAHAADDPRRRHPLGTRYGPHHDMQLAVDGDAARALGELARERWRRATGETLAARPLSDGDPWPPSLTPDFTDTGVALARTEPRYRDRAPVTEVEALFLDAIAAARRTLYVENQYLSGSRIGNALAESLAAAEGPEIVIVTPLVQAGRLERSTMGVLRARLLRELREHDRHGRLRVLAPIIAGGAVVNVHAKVMIVDDRLLRVGSANLSDRSMALDTECDAAIEAEDDAARRMILTVRDGLLAEHLGVERSAVRARIERTGSMLAAIDALSGGERTLVELDDDVGATWDALLPDGAIVDPDRGLDEALVAMTLPTDVVSAGARRLPRLGLAIAAALAVAGPGAVLAVRARRDGGPLAHPAVPFVAVPVFALASLAWVPVTLLVSLTVLALGAKRGGVVAIAGVGLGALAGHRLGRELPASVVEWLGGGRAELAPRASRALRGRPTRGAGRVTTVITGAFERVGAPKSPIDQLARHGLLGVIALRLVPIAPFNTVNVVLGGGRVALPSTLLGTALGTAPGVAAIAFAITRVAKAVRDPRPSTIAIAAGSVLALGAGLLGLRRVLSRRLEDLDREADLPEAHAA